MILNNAKYEAERRRRCEKRRRKKIDGRTKIGKRGGWPGIPGRGERGDISDTRIEEKGQADEIIGLSRAQ